MKIKTKQDTTEIAEVIECQRWPYWQRVCIPGVPWLLTTAGWWATNHGALLILMIGIGMITLCMTLGGRMMTNEEMDEFSNRMYTHPDYDIMGDNIYHNHTHEE